ncbi:MAG: rod shape-determining protein RodA [Thermodesulfovibrionales bacterium]|nr:rod shape-determining protein RodA [Thermodesulfovibrionales bacterium]
MLRIDRRLIKNFDWITLSVVMVIALIGIMTIYSATRPLIEGEHPQFYIRQALWLILGVIALFLMVSFDYIWLGRFSLYLYIVGTILLIAVFIFSKAGMGAQRWLSLGPISFQPSEFFKLIYIIMLSQHLSITKGPINTISLFRVFFLIVFLPFILLLKQPNLGTALIILAIFVPLMLAKGLHKKIAILFVIIGLISLPFLGNILWEGLRDYQKSRLIVFLEPGVDPTGIGYHISQSKITVGSGKFLGKGYLRGTQGPFRFLPEKHTDFIFAVFAEEWGFLGSLLLLFLYLVLIRRGLDTAKNARDDFGRFLALGITFMFSTYFFVNVGMTLGIMPVVGIPLPFMSYGGTALLSNLLAVGLLISIRTRRFELFH